MSKKSADSPGVKILAENRKARFNFNILEAFEAGLVLTGSEIKSMRNGGANIAEAYIRVINAELHLIGAHINPYIFTQDSTVDPVRSRKLLMHKNEIIKLQAKVAQKGLTIVPLELYLKAGWAKIKIALASGKSNPDKRHSIKERDANRAIAKALKNRTR